HRGGREPQRGGRAVFVHPRVEHAFDAFTDGGERPERVVEVEGDGTDRKAHESHSTLPVPAARRGSPPRPGLCFCLAHALALDLDLASKDPAALPEARRPGGRWNP